MLISRDLIADMIEQELCVWLDTY